ncbi:MAG TPA: hypothetical protein VGM03_10830 [Phycisphaerae bacterium]
MVRQIQEVSVARDEIPRICGYREIDVLLVLWIARERKDVRDLGNRQGEAEHVREERGDRLGSECGEFAAQRRAIQNVVYFKGDICADTQRDLAAAGQLEAGTCSLGTRRGL